jgi:flagellar motility protein MotE (MotC chaperone)
MIKLIRELRILPVVMLAAGCLLALKMFGIALDGGYILSDSTSTSGNSSEIAEAKKLAAPVETVAAVASPAGPAGKQSWAQEVFGFPETTGSVPDSKPAEKPKDAPSAANPPKQPDGKVVPLDSPRLPSPGERAVLERLQDRRQELDARSREIEIRENLLKATQKRLEAKQQELKDTESRIATAGQMKDEAAAARFKGIVVMYENMKAKDAAKVFDRLEMKVLIEIASQINPRRMSDIMAQMSAESAERLTVEMAARANGGDRGASGPDLPKIEGKPNGS